MSAGANEHTGSRSRFLAFVSGNTPVMKFFHRIAWLGWLALVACQLPPTSQPSTPNAHTPNRSPYFHGLLTQPAKLPITGGTFDIKSLVTDPDGDPLSFTWTFPYLTVTDSEPKLLAHAGDTATLSFPDLSGNSHYRLLIKVTAEDSRGGKAYLEGLIHVKDEAIELMEEVTSEKVAPIDGKITTFAGTGDTGFDGDGGPAEMADVESPSGIVFGQDGSLYISQRNADMIRKIDKSGKISTYYKRTKLDTEISQVAFPDSMAIDADGRLYLTGIHNHQVLAIDPLHQEVGLVVGNGQSEFNGDGSALSTQLDYPISLAVDRNFDLFVAEHIGERIRKVAKGQVTTIAGTGLQFGFTGEGELATRTRLRSPRGLAVDSEGRLHFCSDNHVFRMERDGSLVLVAGDDYGSRIEPVPARQAKLGTPTALAFDSNGNLFVADAERNVVFKIDSRGMLRTVVGNGYRGYGGDGGPPHLAQLAYPKSLAVDSSNNLYIAEISGNRIRKVVFR